MSGSVFKGHFWSRWGLLQNYRMNSGTMSQNELRHNESVFLPQGRIHPDNAGILPFF